MIDAEALAAFFDEEQWVAEPRGQSGQEIQGAFVTIFTAKFGAAGYCGSLQRQPEMIRHTAEADFGSSPENWKCGPPRVGNACRFHDARERVIGLRISIEVASVIVDLWSCIRPHVARGRVNPLPYWAGTNGGLPIVLREPLPGGRMAASRFRRF